MAGKKNKGKKRAPGNDTASMPRPTALSPRLSADAAEWHPPSFVAAAVAVENKSIQEQPEPKPAIDFDEFQKQPTATTGDAQQPCSESVTPPSTPREDEYLRGGSMPLHGHTGFTPCESTSVADTPTTTAVESAQEASISTVIENSTCIAEGAVEELPMEGSAAEAEDEAAAAATTTVARGTVADQGSSQSQAADVPEVTLENSEERSIVHPVEIPATAHRAAASGGTHAGDTATPEPCTEKPAGGDGADSARGEKESTDATSNPTDDSSGSDPEDDLSGSYGGDKGSDQFFAGRGGGGSGGGILGDPKWRWGGVAAMAAVVLAFSLRRR